MIKVVEYSSDIVRVYCDGVYVGTITESLARRQGLIK